MDENMSCSEALEKAQSLEAERSRIIKLKRETKFMSPEWKKLNRAAAELSRVVEYAWRIKSTIRFNLKK